MQKSAHVASQATPLARARGAVSETTQFDGPVYACMYMSLHVKCMCINEYEDEDSSRSFKPVFDGHSLGVEVNSLPTTDIICHIVYRHLNNH